MGYQAIKVQKRTSELAPTSLLNPVHIKAKFYLFQPQVGSNLFCVVQTREEGRVTCLVHGVFIVDMISPPSTSNRSQALRFAIEFWYLRKAFFQGLFEIRLLSCVFWRPAVTIDVKLQIWCFFCESKDKDLHWMKMLKMYLFLRTVDITKSIQFKD